MANRKINELVSRVPSLIDLMLVGDPSSGYSYKCTVNDVALAVEAGVAGNYVTLATTQTISGAKTFSNVLTLTSVANSPTDTDKFLVLSASNVVNYRTGTQVLSDIGGQGALTLTTTGTSGAATLVGNTLNIPQYQGQISLSAIGSTPNANGATLSSNTLNLQPASGSFGGVVTTGFQEFAGQKRFLGNPIQFDNHLEVKNNNSWGVSWNYTSFASKDTLTFGFLRGHAPNSTTYYAWFTYGSSGDRNYTLPSTDGTLALTSDVTGAVSGTTNYIPKFTSSSAIGNSNLQTDASGNLGLGVTPSAWSSTFKSIDESAGNLASFSTSELYLTQNGYNNTGWKYTSNGFSSQYLQVSGQHRWLTAASGTAGNAITFTQAMTLNASGRLFINATTGGNATLLAKSTTTGNITIEALDNNGVHSIYLRPNNSSFNLISSNYFSGGVYLPLSLSARETNSDFVLSTTGNVGIGTSSPNHLLTLNTSASSATVLGLYNSTTDPSDWRNWAFATNNVTFGDFSIIQSNAKNGNPISAGTTRLYIANGGNVGIGTTSPQALLHVSSTLGNLARIEGSSTGNATIFYSARNGNADEMQIGIAASGYTNASYPAIVARSAYVYSPRNLGLIAEGAYNILFQTNGSERMRITSGGNVGIGTTSPTAKLHIVATSSNNALKLDSDVSGTYTILEFANAGTTKSQIYNDLSGGDMVMRTTTSANLIFGTNSSERMRITSSGELLVSGTYNPYAATNRGNITLNGTAGNILAFTNNTTFRAYIFHDNTNLDIYNAANGATTFATNNAERMRITSGGSLVVGGTTADASAIVQITSTTKGFLPPVMTGAQAEAISATPAAGLLVYANNGNGAVITSIGWWGYNGTTWVKLN